MISTAILAAPYAVCQPVSLLRMVASSLDVSRVSQIAERKERATAFDVATSALGSLRDARPLTSFAGGVGVEISANDFDLKRRRMVNVDGEINPKISLTSCLTSRWMIDNVTTAPAIALGFDPPSLPATLRAEAPEIGKPS